MFETKKMKRIGYLIVLSFMLFNCSNDNGNGGEVIKPPVDEVPVAVNDAIFATEDTELIISGLLDNDTVITGARITSFDANSSNGVSIVDNRNGTYSYIPPAGFVGVDTFNYTLCDNDDSPDCSSATVTITVNDEGSPNAVNDAVSTVKNISVTIDNFLDNDDILDDATLNSIDESNATGIVILNTDGTISYTPPTDFLGDDSFS